MAELVIHNTLGSQSEVTNSIKGANLVEATVSPAYDTGKFNGNGTDIPHNATISSGKFHYIPSDSFSMEEFAISFWAKRTSAVGTGYSHGFFGNWGAAYTRLPQWYNYAGSSSLWATRLTVYDDSGTLQTLYQFDHADTEGFEAFIPLDEWHHWAVTFDKNAESGERIKIYRDGKNIPLSIVSETSGTITGTNGENLYLGADNTGRGFGGVVDNLKIYDFAKKDYSDKDWEFYPPVQDHQQFNHADRAAAVYSQTGLIPGASIEIDMPGPDNHWALDEETGDLVVDAGSDPIDGINYNGEVWPNQAGNSYKFGGTATGERVEVTATASEFSMANSFTASVWFKIDSLSGEDVLIVYGSTMVAGLWALEVYDDSGTIKVGFRGSGFGTWVTYDVDDDHWHQMAVVWDTDDASHKLYLDGLVIEEIPDLITPTDLSANKLAFGSYVHTTANSFNGWMKNIRFYTEKLTQEQIKNIYEEEKEELVEDIDVKPIHHYGLDSLAINDKGQGLLLLPEHYYAMDETEQTSKVVDGGSSPINATPNNSPSFDEEGKYERSHNFNGSTQYHSVASPGLSTTNITILAWVNVDTLPSGGSYRSIVGTESFRVQVGRSGSDDWRSLQQWSNGSSNSYVWGDRYPFLTGTWYHVAIVKEGSVGYVYTNGKLEATGAIDYSRTINTMYIGRAGITGIGGEGPDYMDGDIDEFYTFNKALTQQEILAIMNNTDPRRLAHGTLSAASPTVVDDAEKGNCLSFNGSSNSIDFGDAWDFGWEDEYAVSGWFKTNSSGTGSIINRRGPASAYKGWEFYLNAGGKLRWLVTYDNAAANRIVLETDSTYNDDNWHHFYCSYDGTKLANGMELIIDGVTDKTVLFDELSNDFQVSETAKIGVDETPNYFDGRLQDIKVWKK